MTVCWVIPRTMVSAQPLGILVARANSTRLMSRSSMKNSSPSLTERKGRASWAPYPQMAWWARRDKEDEGGDYWSMFMSCLNYIGINLGMAATIPWNIDRGTGGGRGGATAQVTFILWLFYMNKSLSCICVFTSQTILVTTHLHSLSPTAADKKLPLTAAF